MAETTISAFRVGESPANRISTTPLDAPLTKNKLAKVLISRQKQFIFLISYLKHFFVRDPGIILGLDTISFFCI